MISTYYIRRRTLMAQQGGTDEIIASYTGTYTDHGIVNMADGKYRLFAFTSSGTLNLSEKAVCEVCVVGGGANAPTNGNGGAGGHLTNGALGRTSRVAIVVGAAGGASSAGDITAEAVSGSDGGSGGGAMYGGTPGKGDGQSKYPFNDTVCAVWASKPHCGGGGGEGKTVKADETDYPDGAWYCYVGGSGGSNGGDGNSGRLKSISTYNSVSGGSGGSYGGGTGIGVRGYAGSAASYYGGGGGGRALISGTTYAGYQGIVYLRIKAD